MTTAPVLFQNMPPLTPEEYTALEASILEHGILSPVITDEAGVILDGHHRSKIASEHGISCPKQIVYGKTDTEKRTMALSLNLDRRHLNREQKRALVAESVKADPKLTDREHARRTGTSHPTVATVRADLEKRGDVESFTTRTDSLGREQPVKPAAPANVNTETGEIEAEPVKPRRRPINELLREAGAELDRAVERINRLAQDDRYAANTDLINPYIRNAIHQLETIAQEN